MYDIDSLRRQEFPHAAQLTYLNHAGISPLPQRTKRAVQEAITQLARNPNEYFSKIVLPAYDSLKASIAGYINAASPGEIVGTTTTSAALNAIAQAVDWRPGDNIIFCDLEFPSNAYPWMSLARDGVEPRCVPADNGGLTLRRVLEYADNNTRAVAVSAVQFFTGQRADLSAIGRFCREHGILFIVDAIQSIGHMATDVQSMNIDVLATGGMKSLLAIPGTGFLYVRDEVAEAMRPRLIHGNSTADYLHWLDYDLTMATGAARFASGSSNVPGIMAIIGSLSLICELGPDNIDKHTTSIARYAAEGLSKLGLETITPRDAIGPIVTFRSPHDSEATDSMVAHLASKNIVVCKHLDAAGSAHVRISCHCYNTKADIDHAIAALGNYLN